MSRRTRQVAGNVPAVKVSGGRLQVQAGNFPAPLQHVVADHAWIELQNGLINLSFVTVKPATPSQLLVRLDVRLALEMFAGNMVATMQRIHPKLRAFAEQTGLAHDRSSLEKWVRETSAERALVQWASVIRMAYAGGEAQLDFYQLTVSQIANTAKGQAIENYDVIPLMRVSLATVELDALLTETHKIAEDLGVLGAT